MPTAPIRSLSSLVSGGVFALALGIALPAPAQQAQNANAAPRAVTPRGELYADEKATIALFERGRGSVVYITTRERVRDFWSRNVFSVPRGSG